MAKIRLWRIVPQTMKNNKGVEVETLIRQIRFYPRHNKNGGLEGFGILTYAPWQVCIQRAGWPDGEMWKIRFNRKTGFFTLIYGETMDPIDPWDKRWVDKRAIKRITQDERLTTDGIEAILRKRVKMADPERPDQIPDEEFIQTVLEMLILASEGVLKEAA